MKDLLKKIGTYFVDSKEPEVISSRRVNALLAFIGAVVFFALGNNIAAGALLGASFGSSALTLGGGHE